MAHSQNQTKPNQEKFRSIFERYLANYRGTGATYACHTISDRLDRLQKDSLNKILKVTFQICENDEQLRQ